MTKLLLLLGPPGVGKSSVINALVAVDARFRYVSPYVTRPLRSSEADKISVSDEQMNALIASGQLLLVNELYGIRYGTPKRPIFDAFDCDLIPLLDWPVTHVHMLSALLPLPPVTVYLFPPDVQTLARRLESRPDGAVRLAAAQDELVSLEQGKFAHVIGKKICSREGAVAEIVAEIRNYYQKMLNN